MHPTTHPGSIPTSLGRWNGQVMVSKLVLRTLAAHRNDVLRMSIGPKMVALSSKNMFSKSV